MKGDKFISNILVYLNSYLCYLIDYLIYLVNYMSLLLSLLLSLLPIAYCLLIAFGLAWMHSASPGCIRPAPDAFGHP